jgi:hypothetical protein
VGLADLMCTSCRSNVEVLEVCASRWPYCTRIFSREPLEGFILRQTYELIQQPVN